MILKNYQVICKLYKHLSRIPEITQQFRTFHLKISLPFGLNKMLQNGQCVLRVGFAQPALIWQTNVFRYIFKNVLYNIYFIQEFLKFNAFLFSLLLFTPSHCLGSICQFFFTLKPTKNSNDLKFRKKISHVGAISFWVQCADICCATAAQCWRPLRYGRPEFESRLKDQEMCQK